MNSNPPTAMYSPPPPPSPGPATGVFGTRIPSSICFGIGILLFLLPFSEIRCGGTKLVHKSGLDYALGNEWKTDAGNMFGNSEMQKQTENATGEKAGNTRYFILGALGLAVIGLIVSLVAGRSASSVGVVTGVLSAGALIGFMLDLKKQFNKSIAEKGMDKAKEGMDGLGMDQIGNTMNNIKPTLAFTPWFYIAIVAFLAAAFFCYKRMASRS